MISNEIEWNLSMIWNSYSFNTFVLYPSSCMKQADKKTFVGYLKCCLYKLYEYSLHVKYNVNKKSPALHTTDLMLRNLIVEPEHQSNEKPIF